MTYVVAAAAAPDWRAPTTPLIPWRKLRRGLWVVLGAMLTLVSAVAVIVPGHLFFAVLGLGIVLRNSMPAKRLFLKLQRRKPNWIYPLRRLLRPRPEVVRVLWQSILRTERFLSGRVRLGRLRRALRRRMASGAADAPRTGPSPWLSPPVLVPGV